jgi:hypothetical protein
VILDVSALVHLAALDECTLAEDRADCGVEGFVKWTPNFGPEAKVV